MTCTINVADKSQKNLVVYFSMTNTTKSAANKIKKAVNADIVRIQPKTAYTNNYDKLTKLAQKEYKKKTNPKRATKIYNMSQYSTIYIGFPVWWDNCPRLVQAFIKDYNLKGKTVVPFCTSGGSGIDGSMKAVKASAKGADVKDGEDLTDMSSGDIAKWAKKYMAEKSSNKQETTTKTEKSEMTDNTSKEETSKTTDNTAKTDVSEKTDNKDDTEKTAPADNASESVADSSSSTDNTADTTTADNTTEKEGKTLVAYFSATGNTKPYAEQISGSLGADLYEIVPSVPYTSADLNYNTDCRANTEQNDPSVRPEISGLVSDMSQYDTIFIGFPIWWGTCPKIIDTFIEAYDLSGKKIVPFCTSGSTGISTAKGHIAEKCSSSTVEEGHRCANTDDVESWLKSTGYTK